MDDLEDMPELEDFSTELKQIKEKKENLNQKPTQIKVTKEKPKTEEIVTNSETITKPIGFKKGFLLRGAPIEEPKQDKKEVIDATYIKAKDPSEKLIIDDVQKEMSKNLLGNIMEKKEEWVNEDLLTKIQSRPDLLKFFMDPRFTEAIALMQSDPKKAFQLYGGKPEFQYFMTEFSKMMGNHFTELAEKKEENSPLSDPEVKEIMKDPEVMQVIKEIQLKGRLELGEVNPKVAVKIKKLIDKKVFNLERM